MALVCSQCGVDMPPPQPPARINRRWNGMLMCSRECEHAAGSRDICGAWCGCTGYSIKRRLLRNHRAAMRIMDELIVQNELDAELEELLIEETGNTNYYLGSDSEMDEPSDAEVPEQALRDLAAELKDLAAEGADQRAMVQAVNGALNAARCSRTWSEPECSWKI